MFKGPLEFRDRRVLKGRRAQESRDLLVFKVLKVLPDHKAILVLASKVPQVFKGPLERGLPDHKAILVPGVRPEQPGFKERLDRLA